MNKKVYFLLLFVFAISALLLGLSYSKDSGKDSDLKILQNYDDYFRVVYSTNKTLNKDNSKIDFGITNITDTNQDYVVKIIGNSDKKLYYKLDDEKEKELESETIFTSSLTRKGTDGDYAMHKLEVISDDEFEVKLVIGVLDHSLKSKIIESKQVFKDQKGNYRFFGENVDNYIKIDGTNYRIIGLFGDKLRLIGDVFTFSPYVVESDYLSVEDYILSYDKHDLKEDDLLGNVSWLNIDYRFWLESDDGEDSKMVDADVGVSTDGKTNRHYQRIIKEIDGNGTIVDGNGTVSSPYEVSYGSK